jgi:hypothetical protein
MIKRDFRWLLLLPVLIPLSALNRFMVPAGTKISDIMISHYPNLLFLQRSIASGQGIPLWSPLILSGYPFSANPLSSLWYPPAWINLLFPLPLGINLVMATHILAGVYGFYLLLRQMKLNDSICILGGILFGLLPAGFTHIAAGHFTWVCASAWLPWLLYVSMRSGNRWKNAGLQAIFLGLIMQADMRFAAYAGLFWLMFCLYVESTRSEKFNLKNYVYLLPAFLLGIGVGAAVWLPLLEYAGLGTRSLMNVSDTLYLSLPAVQLTGLVVPGHPSSMEWIFYPGAFCLLMVLIGLSFLRKRRDLWFWLVMGLVFFIWAMGDSLPVNQALAKLPGLSLLRVPSRGLYFFGLSLLVAALVTLDELIKNNPEKAVYLRLVTIFFSVMVILLQFVIVGVKPEKNGFILWHTLCWLVVTVVVISFSYRKISGRIFLVALGIFAVADLFLADIRLTDYVTINTALSEGKSAAEYLKEKGGEFRVFSPSYSIPQQTAGYDGLELADGIDPLQIKAYSDYVRYAVGLPLEGYSVTLPPYKTGDPSTDNTGIKPDREALGLLNVRYLVSAFPVEGRGWNLEKQFEGFFIYQNDAARGWAWVESPETGEIISDHVEKIDRTAGKIMVTAEGPGTLVLSEVYYPGWQARVNGQPAEINTTHSIFRSINLTAGQHSVVFEYIPVRVYAGLAISLIAVIICGVLVKGNLLHGQ